MSRPLPPARIEFDDRYFLRPVEPDDIPQIEKALQASLPELRTFMAWAHGLRGREDFLERIIDQYSKYFKGIEYELALFDKQTEEFLVYIGFYPADKINPLCMDIGYWTDRRKGRKGFATLATQIIIALLFEYFKADRVEITCSVLNEGSRRIIEKCGFQFEGELRNFYPKGSPKMCADGYVTRREAALFALIPEDRSQLPWYKEILEKTTLYPLLEPPKTLFHYVDKAD